MSRITYKIHLIDGDVELRLNKNIWPKMCKSIERLDDLITKDELGKRLLKYTDYKIGRNGIFTGMDVLVKLNVKFVPKKSKFTKTVIRKRNGRRCYV